MHVMAKKQHQLFIKIEKILHLLKTLHCLFIFYLNFQYLDFGPHSSRGRWFQ